MSQPPDTDLAVRHRALTDQLDAANTRAAAKPETDTSTASNAPTLRPLIRKATRFALSHAAKALRAVHSWINYKKTLIWTAIGLVTAPLWLPILTAFLTYSIAIWLKFNPFAMESLEAAKALPDGKKLFEDLRNIGLVLLGLIGLPLAVWRSWLAHQQTQTGLRQAATAERGLIIDRFQKGAEMLESRELSVRIAGVFILRELALSDPVETYIQVLDLLASFLREKSKGRTPAPSEHTKTRPPPDFGPFPADLQETVKAISHLRNNVKEAEEREERAEWRLDLNGSNLSGADLSKANLSGAWFNHANLAGAWFNQANLAGAELINANLSDAHLARANLTDADLDYADLSSARLMKTYLSGAIFAGANLSSANLHGIVISKHTDFAAWAFENSLPLRAPDQVSNHIAIRKQDEPWSAFVDRIIAERPELDWDELL
ncbi:pentapeptide repeat-containing protein [Roseibium algae]|uniref:Pentapeptide repeat-containing protein n=1 Tax=Roseibium algae TaxID=3123038 RepID=A0ABU8TJY7_9HYPH